MSRPTQDTGTHITHIVYGAITHNAGNSKPFHYTLHVDIPVLQPQYCRNNIGLGCFHFARRYYGNHSCFLLLRLLRCFSSARLPYASVVICLQHTRFPHSEIYESKGICPSS